ncbi:MAG: hypothetical protein RR342_01500 [Bacilli bacterium]
MIGQDKFNKKIDEFISNNRLPLFLILIGKVGIGKKTASKQIANKLKCQCLIWGNKIDDIRDLKVIMESQDKEIIYCIPEFEAMSIGAKNSILKICEEPPRNARIILTACTRDVILPTILGRGTVIELSDYSEAELLEISKEMNVDSSCLEFCNVPGDIEKSENLNIEEFKEFTKRVWENIKNASAGNLLKVTNKIKLKEESNGYDLDLFINYLMKLNGDSETSHEKLKIYYEIMEAKRSIQLKYNKNYILDNLLLNIRGIKNGTI